MKLNNKWISAALVLLFTVIVVVFYVFRPSPDSVGNSRANFEISAAELVAAFEEDENEANEKFVDKIVLVQGQINEISGEGEKGVILYLDGESMGTVSCSVSSRELSDLQPKIGEVVLIKGQCKGYILDVVLQKCVIVEK